MSAIRLPRTARATLTAFAIFAVLSLTAAANVAAQGPVRPAIEVTTTADAPDSSAGDGMCRTAGGQCSLRAAVQEANGLIGHDVIEIPAGTYEIEIPVANEDFPSTGDHDIADTVTIRGVGAGQTVLDGGFPLPGQPVEARGIDRIFEIHPSAGDVTIERLTLQEGYTEDAGAAVLNWSPGLLRINRVHLLDNLSAKEGGAISNADPFEYPWPAGSLPPTAAIPSGDVEIVDSKLAGNSAGSGGAAVHNTSDGTVSIIDGEVVDNPGLMIPDPLQIIDPLDPEPIRFVPGPGVYDPVASAIFNEGRFDEVGTIRVVDSTVARNYAPTDGAGLHNGGDGTIDIVDSTFEDNTSEGNGGAVYVNGGRVDVSGSDFEHNLAHADGGAFYSNGATSAVGLRSEVRISQSSFDENEGRAESGAIHSDGDGEVFVTDVDVTQNKATEDAGGGLSAHGRSSLVLIEGRFVGNSAYGEGGGVFTASERPIIIRDSQFRKNTAGVPGLEGNDAGGGGIYTEGGPIEILDTEIAENSGTAEGGGLSIDNHGQVDVLDTLVKGNTSLMDGGGVENSGAEVTFERVTVEQNRATLDGGGIHNASSGEYTVLDTTMRFNRAQNGGGFTNASDSTLVMRRTTIHHNRAIRLPLPEDPEEGGYGGGFYSISDGGGLMENTTISHNRASVRGGGMYHDADAHFRIVHTTVWRNSAPFGGGISTVETDFVPTIPPQPNPLTVKNTIVAGSLEGGSCDWFVTSEGGNIASEPSCFVVVPGSDLQMGAIRDRQGNDPRLDELADNGGHVETHAPRRDSVAVDGGVGTRGENFTVAGDVTDACPEDDARGVSRPQNLRCDVGAVEYAGPAPDPDAAPPDTQYLSGPVQDSLETNAFHFTGTDDTTPASELIFECRLIEHELTEAPEPQSPFEAIDPMFLFQSCNSGWQTELFEDGLYTFEVRAIDRHGRVDQTPATHTFNGLDLNPPDTIIVEKPPLVTTSRAATFTFSGVDNGTPAPFLEYECRLDSRDPEMWLECFNPTMFSNLTTGEHTLEVRALDGAEQMDPTPARYTWTVGPPANCDQANITLTPTADGWVDEVTPTENHLFDQELEVRSDATGNPEAQPPEPIVGQNARTLIRFPVPVSFTDCELVSATLRLHAEGMTENRTIQAIPLAGPFKESTLTWMSQPGTLSATPAESISGEGYREWDVKAHVEAMTEAGVSHGWQIRDAHESDLVDGGDQSYASREAPQDPPEITLPELRLRYEPHTAPPPTAPELPAGIEPTTVSCGQVLTEHTLVGNDLSNCPGEGLVVGASNIVVDLNGHTIDGPNYLLENVGGQEEGFPAGIRISGRSNVTIRNGTVQEFGWGVLMSSGTTRSVVDNVDTYRNAMAGIELFDADDGRNGNTVQNSRIADNELGVLIGAESENSLIADNRIEGNLGEQIFIHNSFGHRIEGNTMHGIPTDPNLDSDGGVLLEGATDNVFVDNTVHDTGDAGVMMHMGSHRNRVEGGTYYRNGDAGVIVDDSDRNVIDGITSHQQSDGGVVLNHAHETVVRDSDLRFNPSGLEAGATNNLLVAGNDASDSLQIGLELGEGVNIRVLDNTVERAGGGGISMEGATFDALGVPIGGALIRGNTVNQNDGDGLSVADGGHRVQDNAAHHNFGWGINIGENPELPNGPFLHTNVDLGGNTAGGNEIVEQCSGLICTTGTAPPIAPLDVTPPTAVIDEAPADGSGSTSATFVFHGEDQTPDSAPFSPNTAMEFECRLDPGPDPLPEPVEPDLEPPNPGEPPDIDTPPDGEGWVECTSPMIFHDLDAGEHRFQVRATDFADLTQYPPTEYVWNIEPRPEDPEAPETIEPETRLASGPPAGTTDTSATFRFAGSDNSTPGAALRFECRLDPPGPDLGLWQACTSPKSYSGLEAGTYTFEVRAIDRSGNADSTPAVQTWTVHAPPPDTIPPDTTIESGPDRVTVLTHGTFTFTSDDPDATFECKLDTDAAFSACTSPLELTGVAVGNRVLEVRAVDQAGNDDPTPAAYDWTVSAAPVPTFVHCGMKVTHSILVQNDLVDCLFDGLVVDAHGITIDLNGHTLDGKGVGAAVRNKGFDNVTIKNGRMVDWDWGVALNHGTRRNVVENVRPEMTQEAAIGLGHIAEPDPNLPTEPPDPFPSADSGVQENVIRNNTIIGNSRGIWATANTLRSVIADNSFVSTSDDAIWLERSHHNRVERNEVDSSSGAGVALEGSTHNVVADNDMATNTGGVRIDVTHTPPVGVQSNDNLVERNTMDESGGIEIVESDRNTVRDNRVRRANDNAVSMDFARDSHIRGNDLRANKGGIELKNSTGNVIELNDTSDSESTGMSIAAASFDNEVLRNTSSNNDGDGIYIGDETPGASGSLIQGNVTNNNKGYGIYIPKPAHVIKGNSAHDNGTWGIWVSEGSNGRNNVDGGGNRAQGNAGPLDPVTLLPQQCWMVQCASGPPISVDPVPPDTQILQAPSDPSSNNTAVFRFGGTDNVSDITFQCKLDAEAFGPCESPLTLADLAGGEHRFEVRAVDVSGNVDNTPAVHTWTIGEGSGGTAPVTTIESGPDATTVSTEATFDFVANELNATFECRIDSGSFAPCAWTGNPNVVGGSAGSITYTALSVGTHTFQVRATDVDGNVGTPAAVWSWRVTPAPVLTSVGCSEVVTQSIALDNDLIDCLGVGLIVGANDVTIDLNGHVIDGTGIEAGILNNGFDSVTVKGGHIHEFDYGVQLNPGSSQNVVTGVRIENNQEAGLALSDADQNGQGNTIRGNTITGNSWGVGLFAGSRHTVIRDNTFEVNQDAAVHMEGASEILVTDNDMVRNAGAGVFMQGGGGNRITNNVMTTNLGGGVIAGEELIPSNNNLVEGNTIEDSGGPGIAVVDSTGTDVISNDVPESNGAGIELELAHDTLVRGNDLTSSGAGIEVSESHGNRIEFNNAGSTLGSGISLELSFDNEVVENVASSNGGDGIEIGDTAPIGQSNLIERNSADANGGDGIIVEGAGHTLTANHVMLNGGWGIYAPVGAIDGGGNFAAGNMEPGQCFGIVCTRGATPGAPDTWFLDTPPAVSNSRNASFTYLGRDESTPLVNLVFECRLDSTNDLAWEDCEYPHEIRDLSPGQHTLEIRALDLNQIADDTPAKYTWTYEPLPANDPPEVFIDIKPEPESWALDQIFTFHSDEPDVTFECKVDLWEWEPCGFGSDSVAYMNRGGFEWSLDETEVGLHTFHVRATDFEGNVGTPATYDWRLLGVVTLFTDGPGFTPGTEGEPATGGEVQSSEATIEFESNVADATFECSLDLAPFEPCTSPVHYTGLLQGDHMLQVVATDPNGLSELEAAVYEWEVLEPFDNVPPETTLELAPPDNSSSTMFEFTGTDDQTPPSLLTFECRVDSTSELDWEECTSPYNLLEHYTYADFQLAPGPHRFEVRAKDLFEPLIPDPNNPEFEGNVDSSPVVYEWTMTEDTSPPGTGITVSPPDLTGDTAGLFEWFGTDNATPPWMLEYECQVDNLAWEACSSPDEVSLEPGQHTLRIRAIDIAGNVDETPAARTWTIAAAPIAEITSGPTGRILPGQQGPPAPSTQERVTFTFTSDQPDATFECSTDGSEFVPCTSPYQAFAVDTGDHEFQVRGISATTTSEGEPIVQDPPTSYEWRTLLGPDTTRPDTEITDGPDSTTVNPISVFRFTGSDNRTPPEMLEFECSLDGQPYNGCQSPEEYQDLLHGPHELLVRAIDLEGNVDITPARYTWNLVLPPQVTILTGPDEVVESTSATFTWTSTVPGSTYQCWLDGAIVDNNCTSPVSYDGLAGGDHLFAVLATSPQGHVALEWEEWEWTIGDVTPPITTIHTGPAQPTTTDTSATFTFSASKPNSTFMCSLDGREPEPCESPLIFPRLRAGEHILEVTAFSPRLLDRFGVPIEPDYDEVPVTYEWEIEDTEAPNASIDWGPPLTTTSTSAVFGLSSDDPTAVLECSIDGSGFSECDPVAEFADLDQGPHTLLVRARDLLDNVDQTPDRHDWEIVQPGPPNTPAGTNVIVNVPMPDGGGNATFTFFEVNVAGTTIVDAMVGGPELPAGYTAGGARYYDIQTTAAFGEPAQVCLAYDPSRYATSAVRLLQSDGGVWMDVTSLNNPFTGRICAIEADISQGESSLFAVAAANSGIAPFVSILSGPPLISNSPNATFELFADMPNSQVQCSLDGLPYAPCGPTVTYTHLEAGDHDLQVVALSPFGLPQLIPTLYEWEIVLPPDTEPPNTTITKPVPPITGSYINWLEFTGTDNYTDPLLELEFQCSIDGGVFESCESPEEIEVLTPGDHRVEVRAVDEALNVDPTPAVSNFTVVDVSVPDTSIDTGPADETTETTATFTYTGEEETGEPVFEFECMLDDTEFVPCSEQPYTITGVSNGPHVLYVRAKDPAGNVDPSPDFYEWLVTAPPDTVAPDTAIAGGPAEGELTGPDVLFAFQASEALVEFECRLDSTAPLAWEGCEGLYELTDLQSGPHRLEVRAVDMAEPVPNVDPTPAVRNWVVLGVPDTVIDNGPPAETQSASAQFTFHSDHTAEQGVSFQCSTDGSEWVPCTSPFTAGPLEAGDPQSGEQHEFEVRAVSRFVNIDGEPIVDETPATYTWTVFPMPDPPAFDTVITQSPPVQNAGGPDAIYEFRFEAVGPMPHMAIFECSMDFEPFEECELPTIYEGLSDGEHVFRVRAVDPAEQPDASPATFEFVIEDAPQTALLTADPPANSETDSPTATFTFSSDNPAATFQCALDTTVFTDCTSGQVFTVPHGDHEIQIRAKGPVGSVDQTPIVHEWTTGDLTPPIASILSGPTLATGGATDSTTATFVFGSDDPDAQYLCTLTGAPDPVPVSHEQRFCDSPVTYTDLAPGLPYTFEVEPTKPFLLVSAEPATWEWTITDTTPPDTTVVSGPGAAVMPDVPAVFTFSSNEPHATFECALDGGDFNACQSPHELGGLEPGSHTLLVRAVDLATPANVDATPASHTWTVIGAPTTTLLTTPAATTTERSATFTFEADQPNVTFACSIDGLEFEPCVSGQTYPHLSAGEHEFAIQATNEHDMVEEPAVTYLWTILDETPPETSIELGPAAVTGSTTATFGFSSNEADAAFECALDTAPGAEPAWNECAQPPENTAELTGLEVGEHSLLVRAVDPSGNADASPEAYDWTIIPPGAPNTPVGTDVTVTVAEGGGTTTATATFGSVTTAGYTLVTELVGSSPLPLGYLAAGAEFYDLSTTAVHTGSLTVCLTYDANELPEPVRLLHFDGSAWVDVTATNDRDAGRICGEPGNLGAFAVATATTSVVPDTSILAGPPAETVLLDAEFAFEADSVLAATFECALDTPAGEAPDWGSCEATHLLEGLLEGDHELLVRAVNELGMSDATPARHRWTIVPLDTFIDSGPDEATEETSATFEFSSNYPGDVTFECLLDEALTYVPCASPLTYTDLIADEHSLLVRAKDPDGNVDQTPAEWEWAIGDVPDPVTITVHPDARTESRTATFEWTSPDADAVFECSLDGANFSICSSPKTYSGLQYAEHTFQVQEHNADPIVDPVPATYTWTVADDTAPNTTITFGPPEVTGNDFANFTLTTNEALATFECSLDGAEFEPCGDSVGYSGLDIGEHVFEARAVDAAGNRDESPARHEWSVVARPQTTIDSGPESGTPSTSATFEFSSDQAGATFECALDGGPFVNCASPYELTGLANGDHILWVRARNAQGIVDDSPAEYDWLVDLLPETTIVSAPPAVTAETSASFILSANETDVTFECSLDGAAFAECVPADSHVVTFGPLAAGEHTVRIRAVDNTGNVEQEPAAHTWTIDPDAPDTTISGVAGSSFTFEGSDALTPQSQLEFECSLDGAPFAACTSPKDHGVLGAGPHAFEVRAIDAAGNRDGSPARHEWTVHAPDTTIDAAPDDPTESPDATFEFSSDRAGTTFECRLDGADWTACASPKAYAGLADGEHVFRVRAKDGTGPDPTPAEHGWEIGDIPATVTIGSAPAPTTLLRSASFEFTADQPGTAFECSLDASPFAPCTSPKAYSGLATGEHTFRVRAQSAEPVFEPPVDTHTWTIEEPPPCTMAPATLSADADSWIEQSSPAANKGTDSVLKVMSKGPSHNLRALVRFAYPNLPANCVVADAKLRLYAASAAGGRTLQALRVAGNWDEGAVTWDNQPATAGAPATTGSGTGYREWNVTSQVRTQYEGANLGFLVRDAAENQDAEQQFNSREQGNDRPQIVLTFGSLDFAAPETSIDSKPNATTTSRDASFTFSSSEPGSTFECSLDGAAFAACSSPKAYSTLALGQHEFRIRATDTWGNTDGSPASWTWTVEADTTAPETTIDGGPTGSSSSTSATFTFSSSESGSTFQCSLDGAAFGSCTSPRQYTGLGVGSHEFRVRATDDAGNTDESPAVRTWTVAPACSTVTVGADRDSWVLQSAAGSNFGTDSNLKVDSKSGSNNARALVRFNLPAIPAGCQVSNVKLRLYASSYKSGRTLQALRLNQNWNESAVTWSNQPTTTGSAATAPSPSSSGYVEWTVTSQVQSMYSGSNHGFQIRDATENGSGNEQSFHSREKAPDNPPQLVVTFG
jgi:CSLREA domain-containing protein